MREESRGRGGFVAALLLTGVVAVAGASPAAAHERGVVGGFQVVVGWGDERAYTGFKNSVQVIVSEAGGGAPVTDVGDALKVEVRKGADTITLPLEANFRVGGPGTPGDYRAWLTPTRPGTYTFRLTGTIRGQAVDASFTSSETTFDEVEDVANIQFPVKDPSTGQLATRVDREIPRAVEAGLRQADDRVDGARTLALIGVAAGGLGLLAAVAALVAVGRMRSGGHGGPRDAGSEAGAAPVESLGR